MGGGGVGEVGKCSQKFQTSNNKQVLGIEYTAWWQQRKKENNVSLNYNKIALKIKW